MKAPTMIRAAFATVVFTLAGCASSPPDTFYRLALRSDAPPPPALTSGRAPVVAVAAVTVPDLVDRPQIVTQDSGSRVRVNDDQRWAEPLKLAIGRLVAERIAARLSPALVSAYPAETGIDAELRVGVVVQRFDSEPGVAARDTVLWTVRRLADGQRLAGRSSREVVPADASVGALVDAHALALAAVADEIAAALSELARR
jgi:uncharacterized lipoprotein YmbA